MAEIPINYLKYIDQDGTEKKVYPITVTDAVYDSDGNKLSNVLLGVLKDTDISNVQSDSTTTVPSSALLKATDDKIGDTSSLPGESSNVVSAINQLNSGTINTIDIGPITTDNAGRFIINYSYRKAIAINLLSTKNYAVIRYLNDTQSLVYVFSLSDHSLQKEIETRGTLFYLSI